jgi:hypothetical protein
LEQRVVALEKGAQFDATQADIRQRELEMLTTLREIREAMAKEKGSPNNANNSSGGEVETLQKENETLMATIAKQEFRIRHLISGMEDLLSEKKKASA